MSDKILTAINTFTKSNWHFKRTLLNIIWMFLNITVLISISSLIIGTGWETIWLIVALMYGVVYWLLATMLFDTIIGDEVDNNYG